MGSGFCHWHRTTLGSGLVLALLLLIMNSAGVSAGTEMAREDSRAEARTGMVRTQVERRGISDPATLRAMGAVPRHLFVPASLAGEAYVDGPLPIGYGQTISQPYIVAAMTEALRPEPGMKVLEIGTGSGYQAAVLAETGARVYTVEIVPELAAAAAARLVRLGYPTILVKEGDGYFGWPEHAPFDAIVVTAAAPFIPPPLLDQLKPGGRMVIPVGSPFLVQTLMLVEKSDEGTRSRSLMPVRFVPFRRAE